jgi:hypothetical protein
VSGFFLMELPDRVRPTPTAPSCRTAPAQLAQIAVASAASHQRLTGETREWRCWYSTLARPSTRG